MSAIKCCKDCTERKMGCHSICEKYIKEKHDYDEFMKEVRKKADLERGVTQEAITNMLKKQCKKRKMV